MYICEMGQLWEIHLCEQVSLNYTLDKQDKQGRQFWSLLLLSHPGWFMSTYHFVSTPVVYGIYSGKLWDLRIPGRARLLSGLN